MRYSSMFSVYGGKAKLIDLYPKPEHSLIIEPFAGSAAYSMKYCDREVLLIDRDEEVSLVWEFLLGTSLEIILSLMPDVLKHRDDVRDFGDARYPGLIPFLSTFANVGSFASNGNVPVVSPFGEKSYERAKKKLTALHPKIRHWKFMHGSYEDAPYAEATWFIDPPYNNRAGRRYTHHDIDYSSLGEWCRSRPGQVIVCENLGADWLPFEELRHIVGTRKKPSVEAVYIQ